jgi:putative esterase
MHRPFKIICAFLLAFEPEAFSREPELLPAPDGAPPPGGFVLQSYTLQSAILGETRRVILAVPPSFARTTPARGYPVAIVLDGEFLLATVAPVAAELSRQGQIPELVLVGVENIDPMHGRVRDLTPPGLSVSGSSLNEGGDRFLDFIERELLPALDRQFRTSTPRTIIGLSSGGILATYAAATRGAFRLVIALDGPVNLGKNWLPKKLIARAGASPPPLHFAAYAARFEWPADLWKRLNSTAPATWKLHYEKLERETHNSIPMLGAYLGLREVFSACSKISAPAYPTTSILPYYEKLTAVFGAALDPPEVLMRDVIEDLLMEGRGAAARAAFERMLAAYGKPPNADATDKKIAEAEQRPPPAETVESLLATPFPSPEDAMPFIGEWRGESWMNPETRHPVHLRIRVARGRVVGEAIRHPAPGEDLVQALQYLKIGRDEFTYGFMNGMRPCEAGA